MVFEQVNINGFV